MFSGKSLAGDRGVSNETGLESADRVRRITREEEWIGTQKHKQW